MDISKVILIGNVGREPETRFTQNGTPTLSFSVATNHKRGEEQTTQWFNCSLFGKQVEGVGQYIQKGTRLYLEGRLSQRAYQRHDGTSGVSCDVFVTEVALLGRPREEGAPPQGAAPRQLPSNQPLSPEPALWDNELTF